MHNVALIIEHAGADLFKMLLCECDSTALGILIHGIKNSIRWCLKSTTFVPVVRPALLKEKHKIGYRRFIGKEVKKWL